MEVGQAVRHYGRRSRVHTRAHDPPEERGEKLIEKFYDVFHYSARTDAQKKIMEEMLERIFS